MNPRLKRKLINELKHNRSAQLAIVVLMLLILLSIIAPLIARDPNLINVRVKNQSPSLEYWFGTDALGRDYFARALYGGRVSLMVGILTVVISTLIGTTIGVVSAYFGGIIDNVLMRIVDILMSVPNFFLIVILNTYLKPGLINVILILGFFSWMSLSRIVRSQTLALKKMSFIEYSQAIGTPRGYIIKQLMVNNIPTIIVSATLSIGGAILTESSLSFFGLGVAQPNSSWGNMLGDARGALLTAPHLAIIPGLLILITVMSFNRIGEVLRRAFAK